MEESRRNLKTAPISGFVLQNIICCRTYVGSSLRMRGKGKYLRWRGDRAMNTKWSRTVPRTRHGDRDWHVPTHVLPLTTPWGGGSTSEGNDFMWPFGLWPGAPILAKDPLSKLHTTEAKTLIFKSPTHGLRQWC